MHSQNIVTIPPKQGGGAWSSQPLASSFKGRIKAARPTSRGFFWSVDNHVQQCDDVDVRFAYVTAAALGYWL